MASPLAKLGLTELDHVFFLDLEETVIDEWDNGMLLQENCRRIGAAMKEFATDLFPGGRILMGLMSWAVWNGKDKTRFLSEFREPLEDALGHRFSDELLLTMDDWAREVMWATGRRLSRDDLFDMFGKHEVLFSMRRHPDLKVCKVTLVDDTVDHGLNVTLGPFRLGFMNIKKRW